MSAADRRCSQQFTNGHKDTFRGASQLYSKAQHAPAGYEIQVLAYVQAGEA